MTNRIAKARSMEHAVSFNMANKGDAMTTREIKKQINMQKMHNARTKRAFSNIVESEKLHAQYGGLYTEQELQVIHDLHPGLKAAYDNRIDDNTLNEVDIAEVLTQLAIYTRWVQEDNFCVV